MIREFAPSDAERVSALIRNTLLVSNSRDYELEVIRILMDEFSPERILQTSLERSIYLAAEDNVLLGSISLGRDTIHDFFVVPNRQREGVGSLLLRHVEQAAGERGRRTLSLASSITAIRFYKKRGWSVTGKEFEGPFGRTIGMRKLLSFKET